MLSLSQAWGTKFFPTAVEPSALNTLIFASAMNLTGARSLSESALQANCHRAAQVARPFAECAEFIQRNYNKHPDYQIVVLGLSGIASHAVIMDNAYNIVFDSYSQARSHYLPETCFTYVRQGFDQTLDVLSSSTFRAAYEQLQDAGYWKDNAWSWDVDMPRGQDRL